MYSFSTISTRQLAGSLLGFAVLASARPSTLLPRFSGPIYEARSPVVHDAAVGAVGAKASRLITVVVGGPQDTFVPNLVRANVGDIVQFQFSSGNHTVTQSAEGTPCIALQATDPKAIHSGHIPYQSGQADVGTFNMPITTSDPMFLFCATGPHCQEGQVMVVNPTNDDQLLTYAKLATTAKQTVDGTTVVGGQVASVPIGGAAFVAAPEPAGPPGGPPGGGAGGGTGGGAAGGGAAAPPAAPPAAAPPAAGASSSAAAAAPAASASASAPSSSAASATAASSSSSSAAAAATTTTAAAAAESPATTPAPVAGEAAAASPTASAPPSSSSAVAEEAVASPVDAVAPAPPAAGPTEEAVAAPSPAPAPAPAPAAPGKPKGPTTTLTLFGRAPGGVAAEPTHIIYYT